MSDNLIYASVLAADLIGVTIIVLGLFREHQQYYPSWHKIGLIIMAIGMLGQGVQCVQYFAFGTTTNVFVIPVWAFKDWAVAIICVGYVWLAHQQFVQARADAAKKVAQTIAATATKRGRPAGGTNKIKPAVLAKTAKRVNKK